MQTTNEASRWRQALARQIAPVYATNPRVAAVILGGSAARGHADRYSDLEIGVFWHEPPGDADRQAAIERMGADLLRLYPFIPAEQVWCDDFSMGRAATDQPGSGLLIEAVHYTAAFMETVLHDLLERYDPSEPKQNLIAGVLAGIPLHGRELIEDWQARARDYPEGLAVAMVRTHAQIDHFWRVPMLVERHSLPVLFEMLSEVAHKLLRVLLGINRVYYAGFKWLELVTAGLPIAPPDLAHRLNRVFQIEPLEAGRELAALVEETYDLVEEHLPAVDVDRLRRIFRHCRVEWEQPPPGLPGGTAGDAS